MTELKPFTLSKKLEGIRLISAATAKAPADLIPLAYGLPAVQAYDQENIAKAAAKALTEGDYKMFEYGGGSGQVRLAKWIKERVEKRNIFVEPNQVLVTSGSGQGMDIVARTFANEGDEIWVESPTFFGALRTFAIAGLVSRGFDIDENGLKVDDVEAALEEAVAAGKPTPKILYVMPNYHNPGGVTMPIERRQKLAALAIKYNFYILEDDAYAELNFTEETLPAIYSFAPERVIYMSTFSKTIAPGIRIGWLIVDAEHTNKLRVFKSDGSTSVVMQEMIASYLETSDFDAHIAGLIDLYKSRAGAMLKAIDNYFGPDASYVEPEGGFFIWLTFDKEVDPKEFEEIALESGVNFILGEHCFAKNANVEKNHVRLSFSYVEEDVAVKAIQRLADAFYAKYPKKSIV